jgi:competence protein ComFC
MKHIVEKIIDVIFPPLDVSGFFINWEYRDFKEKLFPGKITGDFTSLFSYQDPKVRKLIKSFKKEKIRNIGNYVSEILAEEILNSFNEDAFQSSEIIHIVPVPISKKRMKERGFNQTDWICKLTAKELGDGFMFSPHFLTKVKDTEKQSTLSRSKRLKNPKGSFKALLPLHNKKIILVDDVITTGATISEAARSLKKAGAKDIRIFCIAH